MSKKTLGVIGILIIAVLIIFALVQKAEAPAVSQGNTGTVQANPGGSAITTTSRALIGRWRSTDDTRYSLEIDSNSNAIERYQNDPSATATSSWALFTSASPDPTFSGTEAPGVVYLTLTGGGAGTRHFAVVELTGSTFDMLYLDRGGTLSFTRVQ